MTKIEAVFVIFNPSITNLYSSIRAIYKYVDLIWVTDNSMECHQIDGDKIRYSHQPSNKGIAYGQNLGIQYAIEHGCDWIVFFDQDSKFDEHFLPILFSSFHAILDFDSHTYGIGPMAVNMDSGVELNKKSMQESVHINSNEFVKVRELMCSASVMRTQLFKEVGMMDDTLFIDGVDFEICWRASSRIDAHFYLTRNCTIEHQLGEGDKRILGRNIHIPTPFRAYYQVRNGILLSRRSYVPMKWKIMENIKSFVKLLLFPILLSPHSGYIKSIIRGYYDGLINRVSL